MKESVNHVNSLKTDEYGINMIKLYRADQMHPSSSVVALSSLQKTVRKSREVTDRLIQQLIDTGYIPEEKKPELLSVFDKEMTEYTKLKTKKKKA